MVVDDGVSHCTNNNLNNRIRSRPFLYPARPFERPPRNIIRTKRIRTYITIIYIYIIYYVRTRHSNDDERRIVVCVQRPQGYCISRRGDGALCDIFKREKNIYHKYLLLYTLLHCIRMYTGRRRRDENPKNEKRIYLLLFFFWSFHNAKPITTYKYVGRQKYTHTQYAYGITFSIRGGYPMFMYNARKHPKP